MQRGFHQVAGLGRRQRRFNRVGITNFADDHGIRIQAQRGRNRANPGTANSIRVVFISNDGGLYRPLNQPLRRIFKCHQAFAMTGKRQVHVAERAQGGTFP
ncbi:hypothetical protein D3C87_1972270 [compost metagenome]